jgi:hypothetical protein
MVPSFHEGFRNYTGTLEWSPTGVKWTVLLQHPGWEKQTDVFQLNWLYRVASNPFFHCG